MTSVTRDPECQHSALFGSVFGSVNGLDLGEIDYICKHSSPAHETSGEKWRNGNNETVMAR